jgi:hypothetical protein
MAGRSRWRPTIADVLVSIVARAAERELIAG